MSLHLVHEFPAARPSRLSRIDRYSVAAPCVDPAALERAAGYLSEAIKLLQRDGVWFQGNTYSHARKAGGFECGARDESAIQWDLFGALHRSFPTDDFPAMYSPEQVAIDALLHSIRDRFGGCTITWFNDKLAKCAADVIRELEFAIELIDELIGERV